MRNIIFWGYIRVPIFWETTIHICIYIYIYAYTYTYTYIISAFVGALLLQELVLPCLSHALNDPQQFLADSGLLSRNFD